MADMRSRIYVDETKAKGYLLAAVFLPADVIETPRHLLRRLILPGQRSLHMNRERESRRRLIVTTIVDMQDYGLHTTIYDAGRRYRNEKERRAACLRALVQDTTRLREANVVFDRDETLTPWDRQQMIELTRAAGVGQRLTYTHTARSAEVLLALPDALAWCWARGSEWRQRVKPVIAQVRQV